jgi:hypothetical protein
LPKPPGSALRDSTVVAFAALLACAPGSPQEQVAEARSHYHATLNGFVVKNQPMPEPEVGMEGEMAGAEGVEGAEGAAAQPGAAGEPAAGEGEGEEMMMMEELPVTSDVVLDILVRNDGGDKLPGITVDVTQVDPAENEKGHWRVWVDTSSLGARSPGIQVSHVLPDVDYEEGDGFSVEVRNPVPAAERGEYQEFAPTS